MDPLDQELKAILNDTNQDKYLYFVFDIKALWHTLDNEVNTKDCREDCVILLRNIISDVIMEFNTERGDIIKTQFEKLGITDGGTQEEIGVKLHLITSDIFSNKFDKIKVVDSDDHLKYLPLKANKTIQFPKVFHDDGYVCLIEVLKDDLKDLET